MGKNGPYDEHFKMEAVSLVLDSGKSIASVARELEVAKSTLGNWVTAYREKGTDGFVGSGHLSPEKQAEKDLHKRIRELEEENKILKKATRIFANQQK